VVNGCADIGRTELGQKGRLPRPADCTTNGRRRGKLQVLGRTTGQLMRFGVSTVVSAAMTVGLPILLHELFGLEQRTAVAISQSSALLLNFLMIRVFVFGSRRAARRDLAYYVGSAVFFRGLEYLAFLALFELAHLYYIAALVLTLGTSTLLKFFWYRFLFGRVAGQPA
jgi:putative flippase GtrA